MAVSNPSSPPLPHSPGNSDFFPEIFQHLEAFGGNDIYHLEVERGVDVGAVQK